MTHHNHISYRRDDPPPVDALPLLPCPSSESTIVPEIGKVDVDRLPAETVAFGKIFNFGRRCGEFRCHLRKESKQID